jgi:uncharacterized membrane-anchored protein YitT (DUF2179 family)
MSSQEKMKGFKDYLLIISGTVITAIAINAFLIPYKIAPGGASGVATVIYHISSGRFPVGVTMLIINIPLFILGIRFIGRRFIIKTLFATVILSVFVDSSKLITRNFVQNYLAHFQDEPYSPDILLYSIFGGFLMGVGLGLVFRSNATTGGTDLAAKIINHFAPTFTMGQTLLLLDSSVIIFAAVVFKSFQLALYAIVTLYISSKVIDAILEGVNFAKALFIISDHSEEIASIILSELDRGVTSLKGRGIYTGSDKEVLLCVVHRGQLTLLKKIVKGIDDKAFIILADIREVLGEGFKTYEQ